VELTKVRTGQQRLASRFFLPLGSQVYITGTPLPTPALMELNPGGSRARAEEGSPQVGSQPFPEWTSTLPQGGPQE
jgi:hypothetical protein